MLLSEREYQTGRAVAARGRGHHPIPTTCIIDDRSRVAVRIMTEVLATILAGLIDDVQKVDPVITGLADTVASGSLSLALPIATLAGPFSFFSPCVIPLLPGYLSYVTAMECKTSSRCTAARGALLAAAYCVGLGLPFIVAAFTFVRLMRATAWIRRNQRAVMLAGGGGS